MSVPLDLITHKALILIKQIYQRAVVQSGSHHSDVDRILSLISFDLANETLLKNAITAVDSRAKITSDLNELIQLADRVFAAATPAIPLVPDAQKLRRVRRIRNGAMHEAKYPTAADINDCRTYTRDFIQQVISNVWAKDFDAIRLTDAIHHAEIREFLIKAENKLAANDYTDAAVQAKAALGLALGRVKSSITSSFPDNFDALMVVKGGEAEPSREALGAFKGMRDSLVLAVVGIDYASYRRYERITEHIMLAYYAGGKIEAALTGRLPEADEAEYVVDFTINAVIQIESLVGDIDKPFGEDRWWRR